MKILIKSTFIHEIDTSNPASVKLNKDILDMLVEQYNEDNEQQIGKIDEGDPDVIHDLIRKNLEDDIESVIDLSDLTSENSFDIEVTK